VSATQTHRRRPLPFKFQACRFSRAITCSYYAPGGDHLLAFRSAATPGPEWNFWRNGVPRRSGHDHGAHTDACSLRGYDVTPRGLRFEWPSTGVCGKLQWRRSKIRVSKCRFQVTPGQSALLTGGSAGSESCALDHARIDTVRSAFGSYIQPSGFFMREKREVCTERCSVPVAAHAGQGDARNLRDVLRDYLSV